MLTLFHSVLAKAAKVKAKGRVQDLSTRAEQCPLVGGLTPVTTLYWPTLSANIDWGHML